MTRIAAAVVALLMALVTPAAASTATVSPQRPVILVPGWSLFCSHDDSEWALWEQELAAHGWASDRVFVFHYDTCRPNVDTTVDLGHFVDYVRAVTRSGKVDLVVHSMGALSSRWCIVFGSCRGKVDQWINTAGPNHGTLWAAFCGLQFWSQACPDMAWNSPMLTRLNSVPETPGPTRWATYSSWCDLVSFPFTTTALAGAQNVVLRDECIPHQEWQLSRKWVDAIIARLSGHPLPSA